MQRQIKFRAWDDVANKMYIGDFEQFDDMLGFRFKHFECDKPIYMQFTGLLDCNGNPVYEGDIVFLNKKYENSDTDCNAIVEWLEDGFVLREIKYRITRSCQWLKESKIIGNLHETPDLLTNQGE